MTPRRTLLPVLALSGCITPVADIGGLTGEASGDPSAGTTAAGSSESTSSGSSSTATDGEAGTTAADGASSESSSGGGEGPLLDVGSAETGTVLECDEDAPKLIHVLTVGDEIWTFDPITVTYEFVTAVDCPQIEGYPTGFAIDRDGVITVLSAEPFVPDFDNYPPMKLTRFSPGDVDCEEVFYGAIEQNGTSLDCADLSLVSMIDDPDHERLFAHACTGGGFVILPGGGPGSLFRLDPADAEPDFALLGTDDYTSVPLAGTGDGRLFGVSGDQSLPGSTRFVEYDQDTGAIVATTPVPEIDLGDAGAYFALAFYGGDLYTFGLDTDDGNVMTVVHRYDWDDDDGNGEHEVTPLPEAANHPFAGGLIAAASPTCIPLTPAG